MDREYGNVVRLADVRQALEALRLSEAITSGTDAFHECLLFFRREASSLGLPLTAHLLEVAAQSVLDEGARARC